MRNATFLPMICLGLALVSACGVASVPLATAEPAVAPPTHTGVPSPLPADDSESRDPDGAVDDVAITIVYDNYVHDRRLFAAWGFACVIERGDLVMLFDTGGDASRLLVNMSALGHDPGRVDVVVLSHIHDDHVGGLEGILEAAEGLPVYVPRSTAATLRARVGERGRVISVDEPTQIAADEDAGMWTTGEMGDAIREQALVILAPPGPVVITGCAHPGIVDIVARAKEIAGEDIYLVMGGFHLSGARREEIAHVVDTLRALGVRKVAPCHCSGDVARELFEASYGSDYIPAGVGRVLEVTEQGIR